MAENTTSKPCNLIIENRNRATVSGVEEIISFDEQVVQAQTNMGLLTIKGKALNITKLNIDVGEMNIEGECIDCGIYSNKSKKGKKLVASLLK